jgi:TRAP-type C4-dicarboxylate transport system permease small subunit
MGSFRQIYDRFLEAVAAFLIVALTAIVVLGVVYRWLGLSLVWYDEVASMALAWLTYYAGALAALRGAHIGFAGLVNALPPTYRVAVTLFASAVTISFFLLLAVTGTQVVQILAGTTLVSIPEVSLQVPQSVIPIASVLFVIAELIRLPELVREARRGPIVDAEIKEALATIEATDEFKGAEERKP